MNSRANRLMWTVVGPCLAFAAVVAGVLQLMPVQFDWEHWRPATCMPNACFCEAIRGGTVRQVANTWSSLSFVFVAFCVAGLARSDRMRSTSAGSLHRAHSIGTGSLDRASAMSERAVFPIVFALALFVVGMGSAFYHASLTFAGQFADVFGMYLIATFVLVYNVGRLRPMSDGATVGAYFLLNGALAVALYTTPAFRRYAFAVVVAAALLVEYLVWRREKVRSDVRYLIGALVALLIAFAVWVLDITRVVCQPESLAQGHAVWHVLGAVACGGVYLYYRSAPR